MKMQPWQQQMFDKITSGEFKPSELMLYGAVRQTGKSTFGQYVKQWQDIMSNKPAVEIIDRSTVDSEQWFTVSCSKEASMWFRKTHQDVEDKLWYEHIDKGMYIHANAFDMHEKLYTLLAMKFAK
jgi:hypothetical protein